MTLEQELQSLSEIQLDAGEVFSGKKSGRLMNGFSNRVSC